MVGQPDSIRPDRRLADLTYAHDHLGRRSRDIADFAASGADFAQAFLAAERPAIVVGQGALARGDGAAVLRASAALAAWAGVVRDGWNGWNILHTAAARVGGLDLGFVPARGALDARAMLAPGALDVLFLLGVDEADVSGVDAFVVYLGTHGDVGAHRADVILPGAAYTEKSGLYVNSEGRAQRGERAVFPKGEAREDWAILRALSGVIGSPLPYDSLEAAAGAALRRASDLRRNRPRAGFDARVARSCRTGNRRRVR